jgi:hypothetical protein
LALEDSTFEGSFMAKKASQSNDDSWTRGGGTRFGNYEDRDEELHPDHHEAHDSLTETWAYMFWIPKARIGCIVYLWVHPNLKLLTGGLTVYQGHKAHHLQGELFDMRIFNSAGPCILAKGRDIRVPNGLRVRIMKPFKTMRVTYADPSRGNLVDLIFTAAAPPVMRESRKHFEQIMDVKGNLLLRGKKYKVNCWGSRDRSWGEPRPENPYPIPPYTWMTGRFPSGIMWCANGHDDPARRPEWIREYKIDPGGVFKDGWIYRDGEARRIAHFSKITKRDPRTRRPMRHDIDLTDDTGRNYHIRGEVIASTPWGGWFNMNCYVCVTRWTLGKEIGYGDTQEVSWGDYIYKFRRQ